MTEDKNDLAYWFPKLLAAGVPVPKTEIIDAGENWRDLMGFFDDPKQFPAEHAKAEAVIKPLAEAIRQSVPKIGGYPAFLRTGMGSGKHSWKRCCDLRDEAVESHIVALVEWSETVDMMGLPWRWWAVRERLPVKPIAFLPDYGDMPLVREMRAFVEGGKVVCYHPYWPRDAIRAGIPAIAGIASEDAPSEAEYFFVEVGGPQVAEAVRQRKQRADKIYAMSLMDMEAEWAAVRLADQVALAFAGDGAWSVDILETDRGMFVTDCAEAHRSYHWEGCVFGR